jgi:hypothetical protein
MAELTLFKNRKGRVNVIAPDGFMIKFANSIYFTRNKEHEAYLKDCAERRACGVYIDPEQPTVDPESSTPHDMFKAKIIREYEEEKARIARANAAPVVNPGDSVQGDAQKSVANTTHTATPQVTQPTGTAKVVEPPKELEATKAGTAKK